MNFWGSLASRMVAILRRTARKARVPIFGLSFFEGTLSRVVFEKKHRTTHLFGGFSLKESFASI